MLSSRFPQDLIFGRRPRHWCVLALLLPTLGACGAGGSTEPDAEQAPSGFLFKTTAQVPVEIRVTQDGAWAPHASIQLTRAITSEHSSEDATSGQVFANGLTTAEGRYGSVVDIPTTETLIDVVVQVPGSEGLYTHPELRNAWGPFAPSARMTVTREQLRDLEIALEMMP